MKTKLILLLAWLMLNCTAITPITPADDLIIRTGTSFGFCIGYCNKTLELTSNKATFNNTSRETAKYPTKTCTGTTDASTWASLKTMLTNTGFSQEPETIGCPDCADGGAEFIEIEQGGKKHRVTFEYGKTIPGFGSVVTTLRQEREKFKDCK
jgi:hypothetical protein